ncbi:uncharacterized mitochondrial protein-like protein [Tanacetum coccineum]
MAVVVVLIWIFDIDALTRIINYEPIVACTQSNGFVGIKASDNASQARKETEPIKDYILLLLCPDASTFFPRSISTNTVNAAFTNEANAVGGKTSIELPFNPNMPTLEDYSIFNLSRDDEDDDVVADMNNLDTTIQEEPKKVIHALKDLSWIEAMQEELLQFKLQEDERRIMIRNKEKLFAYGYTQEEGIYYDEVFAPVARIEAIMIFLAYASFKDFVVYQMDVKSAFLYGKIEEEVYLPELDAFYGELTFFWITSEAGIVMAIFICQEIMLRIYLNKIWVVDRSQDCKHTNGNQKPLLKDEDGEEVDVHMYHIYRSMIGSLMYLTSSRPDIMFVVCICARYQVNPKVSHLHVVKRIFRYLKGQPKLGLWYPKDSFFDLVAYTDSDYTGTSLDRKSTTGGCQFLGCRLISWQCNKWTVVANSTTEAEYMAV